MDYMKEFERELEKMIVESKSAQEKYCKIHRGSFGNGKYAIVIEAPGVTKNDIEITIDNYEQKSIIELKAKYEYAYLMAKKDMVMPIFVDGNIDTDSVEAEVKDGLISIIYGLKNKDIIKKKNKIK